MDDLGNISSTSFSSVFILEPKLRCFEEAPSDALSWKHLSTEDLNVEEEEEDNNWEEEEEEKENHSSGSIDLRFPSNMAPVAPTTGNAAPKMARSRLVKMADVAKAARAASLNEEEEEEEEDEELKTIFEYDDVRLCYGDAPTTKPRTSSNAKVRKMWQRAITKTRILKDPWEKFHFEELPAEKVLRHRYNAASGNWVTDNVIVKMDTEPFGHGAMRECFRMKKISNFARPRTASTNSDDMDIATASDPALWSGSAKNYVAKRYIESIPRCTYFDDVKLQMDAKLWGEEFNRYSPPKPVDIFQMSLIEFPLRPNKDLYHLEHFIEGDYVKYNSNSGYINDKTLRRTPQAFSHFTFERSGHQLIVVDVQGVGDLYTDPQIHTASGKDYGGGNLGTRGMALFFHSHACNRICRCLKLVPFDLSPVERDDQKSLVAHQKNCVTMLRGIETPISPSFGNNAASAVRGPRLSSASDEGYFESPSPKIRVDSDGISDSGSSERKDTDKGDNDRLRLDSILTEEDDMAPSNNLLQPANLCHRGSSVAVEMSLLNQLRAREEKQTSQSILGQMHLDLARYHDQGRFGEDTGRQEIDYGAILFHLDKAAECSQLGAIMALAAILLHFPSDVITNEIPHNILAKFLNGEDGCKRGVDLLRSAAEAGDRSAMIRLGVAFETGIGLDKTGEKSWSEANRWFAAAVDMEDCDEGGQFDSTCDMPLYDLLSRRAAMLTTGGFGLAADPNTAGELYSAAADAAVAAMKGRQANKFYMLAEEAWALVEE